MKTAFLFPGQGAQTMGMGKDIAATIPAVADLFQKANDIVGYDLQTLCFEGPQGKLNATAISQPAIFTVSAALLEAMRANPATDIKPDVVAGLSLGEYTALYACGALSFEDALKLVNKRGQAMQAAADATDGTMVSIIGCDAQQVDALCAAACEGDTIQAANYNCPGQIVISGATAACDRAEKLASEHGAIKAVKLAVAGAFHTDFMASAADALSAALCDCPLHDPAPVKVLANTTADYYPNPEAIKPCLIQQLTAPIQWQASMERLLHEGIDQYYEIGPGRVLTGLMRRINRKTKVINVSTCKALETFGNNK
jgi:[acyl-carrier-protein] S-malonyltransferase